MKLTVYCVILVILCSGVLSIKPVCFNCHCSTLALDNNLRCSEAILNKSTTYFSLRTRNTTALRGSDIMLGIVMKERVEHCWCTDSHLEWNLQDVEFWNDTKLITVTIQNVSIVASGHYWAVLEHNAQYYFSDPIYLNISGAIVPTPSPPLDSDPRMSALVLGILVLVILVSGILIYCWKMTVRRRREKKRRVYEQMQEIHDPRNYYTELQQMSSVIDQMTELGGEREEEEEDEEGSVEDSMISQDKDETLSLSSSDDKTQIHPLDTPKLVKDKPLKTATVAPTTHPSHRVSTHSLSLHPPMFAPNPITDDRFKNQRSWYKSLDVEISSGPLLKDPERAEKEAEKKRQKELSKHSMQNIASSLLGSGMVCSGLMGNQTVSPAAQRAAQGAMLEDMTRRYCNSVNSLKDYRYGRSLPTPIPAGSRPTVMTLFANHSPGNTISKTATIHTSHPIPRHKAQCMFSGMEERNRSVTFCDKVASSNDVIYEKKSKKKRKKENSSKAPGKSNLKSNSQTEEQISEKKSDESTSSSESDEQLENQCPIVVEPLDLPTVCPNHNGPPDQLDIPQLNLITSSPPGSPVAHTPMSGRSRFTVVTVPSPIKQNGEVTVDGTEVIGS